MYAKKMADSSQLIFSLAISKLEAELIVIGNTPLNRFPIKWEAWANLQSNIGTYSSDKIITIHIAMNDKEWKITCQYCANFQNVQILIFIHFFAKINKTMLDKQLSKIEHNAKVDFDIITSRS